MVSPTPTEGINMTQKITMLEMSNYVASTQDRVLSIDDVAAALGIKVASLRVYAARSSKSRTEGVDTARQLPLPDFQFGRSPLWCESTLKDWRGDLAKIQ
jgi:hypothetical protein